MPITLQNLRDGTAQVAVEFEGETGTITYRPGVLTPEEIDTMDEALKGGVSANEGLVELICKLVVDWEVMDGGEKYEITPDHVRKLPIAFLGAIVQSTMKAMAPGEGGAPTGGQPSGGGSFSTS